MSHLGNVVPTKAEGNLSIAKRVSIIVGLSTLLWALILGFWQWA